MKKQLLATTLLTISSLGTAHAVDMTANGGSMTQYIFRGAPQIDGKAVAQGGLDIGAAGCYAGKWFSPVDTVAVAGLVANTPASGSVRRMGSIAIGIARWAGRPPVGPIVL